MAFRCRVLAPVHPWRDAMMTTQYRRRQWRDRRTHAESDLVKDLRIGLQTALAMLFLGLLLLVVFLGDPFINVFLWN